MKKKIKDLLPIGSVVLLEGGEKRLMIDGVMQSDAEDMKKEYDYMGVLYPEGHIGDEFQYLFNQEDIKEVVFRGFEDNERNDFLEKLTLLYEKK